MDSKIHKITLGTALVMIFLIPFVSGEETLDLIYNTDYCVLNPDTNMDECETIYLLCSDDGEPDVDDVMIYWRDDKIKPDPYKFSNKFVKNIDKKTKMLKDKDVVKNKTIKVKSGQYCSSYSLTGEKDPFRDVDNVPCYGGVCYPEYAWWNSSYKNRAKINITVNNDAGFGAGYVLNLTFNHSELVLNHNSSSDGSDIRVVCGDDSVPFVNSTYFNEDLTTLWFNWTWGAVTGSGNYNDSHCYLYYYNNASRYIEHAWNSVFIYGNNGTTNDFSNHSSGVCYSSTAPNNYIYFKSGSYYGTCTYDIGFNSTTETYYLRYKAYVPVLMDFNSFTLSSNNITDSLEYLNNIYFAFTNDSNRFDFTDLGHTWSDPNEAVANVVYNVTIEVPLDYSNKTHGNYVTVTNSTTTVFSIINEGHRGEITPLNFIKFTGTNNSEMYVKDIMFYQSARFEPILFLESNEKTDLNVTIKSPLNITYTSNFTSILLDWSINNNCSSSYYSLDGKPNISTNCGNATLLISGYGSHYVTLYVTDLNGTTDFATTHFFITHKDRIVLSFNQTITAYLSYNLGGKQYHHDYPNVNGFSMDERNFTNTDNYLYFNLFGTEHRQIYEFDFNIHDTFNDTIHVSENLTSVIRLTVYDFQSNVVDDALVRLFLLPNTSGEVELIGQYYTKGDGKTEFYVVPDRKFLLIINHSGYTEHYRIYDEGLYDNTYGIVAVLNDVNTHIASNVTHFSYTNQEFSEIPQYITIGVVSYGNISDVSFISYVNDIYDPSYEINSYNREAHHYEMFYNLTSNLSIQIYINDEYLTTYNYYYQERTSYLSSIFDDQSYDAFKALAFIYLFVLALSCTFINRPKENFIAITFVFSFVNPYFVFIAIPAGMMLFSIFTKEYRDK